MERTALERWGRGDPKGFLEISARDVSYFDPFTERRLDGLAALRTLYDSIRGNVKNSNQTAHAKILSLQTLAAVQAPLRVAVGDIAATVTNDAREEDADLILIGRGSLQSDLGRLRTHAYGIIQRSPCPVLGV